MSILELKPAAAVSVIECDLNVDFAPYVGYQEPVHAPKNASAADDDDEEPMDLTDLIPEPKGFVAFAGSGVRLDGKKKRTTSETEVPKLKQEYVRGIPDYDYEIGMLKFIRSKPKKNGSGSDVAKKDEDDFEAFKGEGKSLRQSRK